MPGLACGELIRFLRGVESFDIWSRRVPSLASERNKYVKVEEKVIFGFILLDTRKRVGEKQFTDEDQ